MVAGVAIAVGSSRVVEGMVYGVGPLDLTTLAGATTLMGLIGIVEMWLPARRAARVDPIMALREP